MPLPDALIEPMERYVKIWRPVLLGDKQSDYHRINQDGDAFKTDNDGKEFKRLTEQWFGEGFRAHAFRHIAATSIAETDPEHVNIIKDILGHSTLETSQKHYNRATGMSASASYQDVIGDIARKPPKLITRK